MRTIDEKIALNIIVKHEVELIKMMLPNLKATPLRTTPTKRMKKPNQKCHYLCLELPFDSIAMFPNLKKIYPKHVNKHANVEAARANKFYQTAIVFDPLWVIWYLFNYKYVAN